MISWKKKFFYYTLMVFSFLFFFKGPLKNFPARSVYSTRVSIRSKDELTKEQPRSEIMRRVRTRQFAAGSRTLIQERERERRGWERTREGVENKKKEKRKKRGKRERGKGGRERIKQSRSRDAEAKHGKEKSRLYRGLGGVFQLRSRIYDQGYNVTLYALQFC